MSKRTASLRSHFRALALSVVSSIALVGAAQAADVTRFNGLEGKIDFAGGTAHIPVVQEAAKRIAAHNPKVKITVAGGGSGVGVQKVGEGLADVGSTGRPVTQQEIERYGLQTFPFAIDGVAVVINPANPVANLSAAQVQAIYAGQAKSWKEFGGPDRPINLITRDEASGTREVFASKILKDQQIAANANVVASNGAVKTAVSRDPNAIGYVGIGHIDASVKGVVLDGVAPSQAAAKDGSYKLTRNLYFNTKGAPSPLVAAFFDYLYGAEGAEIITKSGYIPIERKAK
jgi:phosphate transport system substrate-binding protein